VGGSTGAITARWRRHGGASFVASATAKVVVIGASAAAANVAGGLPIGRSKVRRQPKRCSDRCRVGAGGAVASHFAGKAVKAGLDKLSNTAKGKLGEAITNVKYAAKDI